MMFRITSLLQRALTTKAPHQKANRRQKEIGPVVIWNLTSACNLNCMHCYSSSGKKDPSELTSEQAMSVVEDLPNSNVPCVILSGGEPLMRPDLPELACAIRKRNIPVALSTNGTLIDEKMAEKILEIGFEYVGISLDGIGKTHDKFRGVNGSFDKSIAAIKLLRDTGIKVGVRFTLTSVNINDIDRLINLAEDLCVPKVYLSHLVYSGRGETNKASDISAHQTREVMDRVFERAWHYIKSGDPTQIVTGNNDTDAAYLLMWLSKKDPEAADSLMSILKRRGGNSAGRGVANIDQRGVVHPDPLIQHVSLGNVRKAPFSIIWSDSSNLTLRKLRAKPRNISGRCGSCAMMSVCGGNNRERAYRMTGDFWASDPACYINDEEIKQDILACAV